MVAPQTGAAAPRPRAILTAPSAWLATLRYAELSRRDRRLDLLRGYCVFAMTVDHLDAPTWLYALTGGNRFFVSAAEGFLFISGLVMGLVYRPIVEQCGLRAANAKASRRALLLYLVTVGATLGFMWLSARLGLPWSAGVDLYAAAPRVLTLGRTFYLTDVLLLYTFLIAIAPGALWLLATGRTWVLVGLSFGGWAAHQLSPIEWPWPSEEGAFFYIAAWQLLFFVALAIGWHRDAVAARFGGWLGSRQLGLAAAGLLIVVALWRWGSIALGRYYPDGGAALASAFAKWNLPPARLAACAMVFALFFLLAHLLWRPLRATIGHLLLPLGESALTAYVVHLAVVAALTAYREQVAQVEITSRVRGSAFQLLAVLALWLAVTAWVAGRHLAARLWSERALERRLDPVLGAGFATLLTLGIAINPLPAVPISGFVHVRDDRNSIDELHYAVHVPPDAVQRQPLPVLVLLHDLNEDPVVFGDELIRLSDREGWLLVAPELPYGAEYLDPETIAAESALLLRGLHDVLAELPRSTGLRLRRRALLFGYGRGAAMAGRYALVYPNDVLGAALLGGGGYTLPPSPGGADPPFPFGVKGLIDRSGAAVDQEAARRVRYWVGVGSLDTNLAETSRAWDTYLGASRVERARTLAQALRAWGAPTEYEVFNGSDRAVTGEMRLAVAEFAARTRALPALFPPRLPPGLRDP